MRRNDKKAFWHLTCALSNSPNLSVGSLVTDLIWQSFLWPLHTGGHSPDILSPHRHRAPRLSQRGHRGLILEYFYCSCNRHFWWHLWIGLEPTSFGKDVLYLALTIKVIKVPNYRLIFSWGHRLRRRFSSFSVALCDIVPWSALLASIRVLHKHIYSAAVPPETCLCPTRHSVTE